VSKVTLSYRFSKAMTKLLVVDDETDILDLITLHLDREGYETVTATDGREVTPLAIEHQPALIVLDLMLPGLDGKGVCRALKADPRTRDIPVVMLTAKAQPHDRIAGLEQGADDYLTKPFSPRELMLRIQAVLRRTKKVSSVADIISGAFRLDQKTMVLFLGSQRIDLTAIEFKLMSTLMSNPGVIHSRAELLTAVWGYSDDAHTRTLDTHMKRLREKLGEHQRHVETVRGQGHVFRAVI
jgi:two-component system, OmpR family, phosphate regulon response regulator PhoB